jgi:spore germination protein YaaH
MEIDENLHWLLSYYRSSEISGALFFGQLARGLKPSAIQCDLTRHFADEAQHARYWTQCLERLGTEPLKLGTAYQDQYIAATGMPGNLMEILALTQVFENRVITQYNLHANSDELPLAVRDTLQLIMTDEQWHLEWIRGALVEMESEYGRDHIRKTLKRFTAADREVYANTIQEHRQRIDHLALAQR